MMREAQIFCNKRLAGSLIETDKGTYIFQYDLAYITDGPPIGYQFPLKEEPFYFPQFPVFFENLLSEGWMRNLQSSVQKIAMEDLFGMLIANGSDLVGAITVKEKQK